MGLQTSISSRPYAYFAAPTYLGGVFFLLVGLLLTVIQKRLSTGQTPKQLLLTGVVVFSSMLGCSLTVIEQQQICWIFFALACAGTFTWVAELNEASLLRGTLFCSLGVFLIGAMCTLPDWYWYYLFLAFMGTYSAFVPDSPPVYYTVSKFEDIVESYSTVSLQ